VYLTGSFHFPEEAQLNKRMAQADGNLCADMMDIAIEIAMHDDSFEDTATKFFEHFCFIAEALMNTGYGTRRQILYDVLCVAGADPVACVSAVVGITSLMLSLLSVKKCSINFVT